MAAGGCVPCEPSFIQEKTNLTVLPLKVEAGKVMVLFVQLEV
jgi:hypothetical protein